MQSPPCKMFSSPSEKARFHPRLSSAISVGKEMSLRDPHYEPMVKENNNPFLALAMVKDGGQKILNESLRTSKSDLFSSCFELPSPARVASPTTALTHASDDDVFSSSLPNSPASMRKREGAKAKDNLLFVRKNNLPISISANITLDNGEKTLMTRYFEDQMFQGRVQLLRKLYSGGCWVTQDDSALDLHSFYSSSSCSSKTWSNASSGAERRRRRGSCESGFFSNHGNNVATPQTLNPITVDDWCVSHHGYFDAQGLLSYSNSAKSIGSSLLTVSDLEEDLRAASLFLSSKRTSSVFTDSMDDLSSLENLQELENGSGSSCGNPLSRSSSLSNPSSSCGVASGKNSRYEKDIRHIVEYFEKSCHVDGKSQDLDLVFGSSKPSTLQRSQKIESLIKRVVEKESRDRFRKAFVTNPGQNNLTAAKVFQQQQQQRLQVCDGIVRSKLPLFDASKRNAIQIRSRFGDGQKQGHVKARLAFFNQNNHEQKDLNLSSKRLAEKRLQALANASSSIKKSNP